MVAAIGLSLMLTMPTVTALQTWRAMTDGAPTVITQSVSNVLPQPSEDTTPPAMAPATQSTAGPIAEILPALDRPNLSDVRWVRIVLLTWLSGVALLTLRLLTGWLWVQRLHARGTAPAPLGWQQMVVRLSKRLHISRPIRLFQSAMVEVPTVIGWLRPVVLMPASALTGMGPEQLEAILAHELAHVRRHDYLVNLLQTLVETLLFYHPAVWWLSRRIRIERENCCDDLAVSLCGDPHTYARRSPISRSSALIRTGSSLRRRVGRCSTAFVG